MSREATTYKDTTIHGYWSHNYILSSVLFLCEQKYFLLFAMHFFPRKIRNCRKLYPILFSELLRKTVKIKSFIEKTTVEAKPNKITIITALTSKQHSIFPDYINHKR